MRNTGYDNILAVSTGVSGQHTCGYRRLIYLVLIEETEKQEKGF